MKLAIVATVIDSADLTGVERYALEFIRNIPTEYRKHVSILCNKSGAPYIIEAAQDLRILVSPFTNRVLTDQLWVPRQIRNGKFDFVYNISLSYPWLGFGNVDFSFMMHDATPWKYPETLSFGMKHYYLPQIKRALASNRLRGVVTNSSSSASDISQLKLAPDYRVYPVHLGVDHDIYRPSRSDSVIKHYLGEVYKEFILTVGTIEPRKNLSTLFLAFEKIAQDHPSLHLLIVGRQGWQKDLPVPPNIADRVSFTGYVPIEHLPILYSHAKLFVLPSLYEGFGFPVVEAMCCGTPVVASNSSSLPEIGGSACLYADPSSPNDFAEKINLLVVDEKIRNDQIQKGFDRGSEFTWYQTAVKTWDALHSIAQGVRADAL